MMFLVFIALFSCQGMGGGDNLSSKEGLTAVKSKMVEKFGGDTEFLDLTLITNSAEFCTFEMAFLINDKTQLSFNKYQEDVLDSPENAEKIENGEQMLQVKDFDIEQLLTLKEEATKMIQEKTPDFVQFYLHRISVKATASGTPQYKIELSAEKKDATPIIYGKRAKPGSTFFIFEFESDKNGKLISTKGLNQV